MAIYTCTICGYVYDEEKEGKIFHDLSEDWACPLCSAPKTCFEVSAQTEETPKDMNDTTDLTMLVRHDEHERGMDMIHEMANEHHSLSSAMRTNLPIIGWDNLFLLGAQLKHVPLDEHDEVSTKTIIGKHAEKPMMLDAPLFISHMSFGALSREAKIALAKGSAQVKIGMCSGEGGILPEEQVNSYRYIFEYTPNQYSVTDENLQASDAIEIKIGQGTKPGMGGHLPAEKVTEEIAAIRGKPMGHDIQSPSHLPNATTPDEIKTLVESLRQRSGGRPIGIKIAAGHIEEDLEVILYAEADFVTIDGRGGATGSSPLVLRDSTTVPTLNALRRAKRYLEEQHSDMEIIITGGLRISSDVVKAISLGADAVALASGALMALGCQQYRICGSGKCPMGIATQDPELRKRLDIDKGAQQVANYFEIMIEELKMFARICGHPDIHDFSLYDIVTDHHEISDHTDIAHI